MSDLVKKKAILARATSIPVEEWCCVDTTDTPLQGTFARRADGRVEVRTISMKPNGNLEKSGSPVTVSVRVDEPTPKFTPTEFMVEHNSNMQETELYTALPFYKFLEGCIETPNYFPIALFGYYAGHPIKGAFSVKEISNYKHIYDEFWRAKHARESDGGGSTYP